MSLRRTVWTFAFPQSAGAFGIDHEAFGLGDGVGLASTSARMLTGDRVIGRAPLFVVIGSLRPVLLHRTVLADHPAGASLLDLEPLDEHDHRLSLTVRTDQFSLLIFVRRLVSSAFIPPY